MHKPLTSLPVHLRLHLPLLLVLLSCAPAARADSCDTIRAEIETKLRTSGVISYVLLTVDIADTAPGKVVGSCALGKKKIIYQAQGVGAAGAPSQATGTAAAQGNTVSTRQVGAQGARPGTVITSTQTTPKGPSAEKPGAKDVITECKDGSMSVGGECKD